MDVASNLGSGTMFFFYQNLLGKPTLKIIFAIALLYMFTRAGQKSFVDAYVVLLLAVWMLLQT